MPVITVLVADGVPAHQLTLPGLVFASAGDAAGTADYEVRICSATGSVTTGGPALGLVTPWGLEALEDSDTVLVTGHSAFREPPAPEIADALRRSAARGCRMAAIGTGVFTLAATGLLDGRRATTSWLQLGELAERYPRVRVVPAGTPTVEDGPFHTAAGVFGGLDLCVELVERDHGAATAAQTARRIIMPLYDTVAADRREVERELAEKTDITPTLRWLEANAHRPLTLADLAAHARLSVSSLGRRFRAQTGLPPLQYLLRIRLHEAQQLLEYSDLPVEQIAVQAGFGTPANLRHHFHNLTGSSPRAYRAAFRSMTAILAGGEHPETSSASAPPPGPASGTPNPPAE
ncbi:GlxA family transcriptional regulator [Streptomyces sp. NPDC004609]|uniref:GlxA family transcriptional regulator n=1 Tax=Streptomyces sp. NPDC004609 TaxID=3364704 RepID=UPI00369769DB